MTARVKAVRVYAYRGDVERGRRYEWRRGYSATAQDGGVLYPWMTKRECQQDANRNGERAVFVEQGGAS